MGKADKDGDGAVTKMELAAAMGGAFFESADRMETGKSPPMKRVSVGSASAKPTRTETDP